MSGAAKGKWTSQRVTQKAQGTSPAPSGTAAGNGASSKGFMEDGAISAARIKETMSSPKSEVEVPASIVFESQEATDTLSNLFNNGDYSTHQLFGEPQIHPAQTNDEFYAAMHPKLEKLTKEK